jgi:hypothetical protein
VIAVRTERPVVHHVIQIRQGADDVEQQLGAVTAAHGEHRVPPLPPVLHGDGRGLVGAALGLPVLVEELVEPPVHVDGRGVRPDHPGAERAAAEDVPEPGLDAPDPRRVVDRRARVLVAHEHERGDAAAVRPGPGVGDVAAEVVQHGEDLGEEARAVGADELEQGGRPSRSGGRRARRQCVGRERGLEPRQQGVGVGVGHLAARGVGHVEHVHEPAAVVGGDVALADADTVVGQGRHRLEQHAVLPRAVHLHQRRRRAHAVVHHHPAPSPATDHRPLHRRIEDPSKNENRRGVKKRDEIPTHPPTLPPLPRGVHVAHEELVHL